MTIHRERPPGRFKQALLYGLLTETVIAIAAVLLNAVINKLAWVWGWVFTVDGLERWFTGEYSVLTVPAMVLLTLALALLLGFLLTSNNKIVVRLITWSPFRWLPWAPKLDKSGKVVRVKIEELLMMQPALALIAGKPEVVFIMGDADQNATLFSHDGAVIGTGDWVSVFSPGIPAIINGKAHPVPKSIVLPVRNGAFDTLGWLQSHGKKPMAWEPQLWPDVPLSARFAQILEDWWGIILTDEGTKLFAGAAQ